MAKESVWVVLQSGKGGKSSLVEVHKTKSSADAAVAQLTSDSNLKNLEVKEVEVKFAASSKAKASEASTSKTKGRGKAKAAPEQEAQNEDTEEEDGGEPAAPKKAAAAAAAKKGSATTERKQVPDGMPDVLRGFKLLFTGTFDAMDRKTAEATAKKYGAEVLSMNHIKETNFVVLGTKAGQKKLDEINSHGLETVDEDGFLDMLQNGVPEKYRHSGAGDTEGEPSKKRQKKK